MFATLVHLTLAAPPAPLAVDWLRTERLVRQPVAMADPVTAWSALWTGACTAPPADDRFSAVDHVRIDWLRGSIAGAVVARDRLERRLAARGAEGTAAVEAAYFVPLRGAVAPRLSLSPDALAIRPARGLMLELTEIVERSAASEALFRWHDAVRMPALAAMDGVAGVWSFASHALFLPGRDLSRPHRRLTLIHIDGDPDAVTPGIAAAAGRAAPADRERIERPILTMLLRPVAVTHPPSGRETGR